MPFLFLAGKHFYEAYIRCKAADFTEYKGYEKAGPIVKFHWHDDIGDSNRLKQVMSYVAPETRSINKSENILVKHLVELTLVQVKYPIYHLP